MTSQLNTAHDPRLPLMQRRNARPTATKARSSALIARGIPIAVGMMLVSGVAACSSPQQGGSAGSASSTSPASSTSSTSPTTGAAASSTPTPGPSHGAVPKKDIIAGLITFSGRFRISGAHHTHFSFHAFPGVTSPKSSCSHIAAAGTPAAKGQGAQFRIPAPPQGGDVSFAAEVEPYHGPGTYRKSSVVAVGASVIIGSSSYSLLAPGAAVSVTFSPNGSGKLRFTNAAAAATGAAALSGTSSGHAPSSSDGLASPALVAAPRRGPGLPIGMGAQAARP